MSFFIKLIAVQIKIETEKKPRMNHTRTSHAMAKGGLTLYQTTKS